MKFYSQFKLAEKIFRSFRQSYQNLAFGPMDQIRKSFLECGLQCKRFKNSSEIQL